MAKTKLSDIDLNELDFENIGNWPAPVKYSLLLILSLLVLGIGYKSFIEKQVRKLNAEVIQERELKNTYRFKYQQAVNLEVYRQQLATMESQFSSLLKTLPAKHETPGLLDDITFVGTNSGLRFVKIDWEPEIEKEFYTELPINIEVLGDYHKFGVFLSKIAALPRIVTVHNFDVKTTETHELSFKLVAKTYRYKEVQP